jgi:hypothetical protein
MRCYWPWASLYRFTLTFTYKYVTYTLPNKSRVPFYSFQHNISLTLTLPFSLLPLYCAAVVLPLAPSCAASHCILPGPPSNVPPAPFSVSAFLLLAPQICLHPLPPPLSPFSWPLTPYPAEPSLALHLGSLPHPSPI